MNRNVNLDRVRMHTICTDRYLPFIERVLTPPRYQHSLGVMGVMAELAEIYSLDCAKAMTAGLLHDAAKDLSLTHQLALAEEAGIKVQYLCDKLPVYLHGPVGAYLVSEELGIGDFLILDAISNHTYYGSKCDFNTPFARCLRVADILAPIQEWKGMKKLKSMVYAGELEKAALLQAGWLIEYFQELNIPVSPMLADSFQTLSAKLNVDDGFFERW